VVSPTDTSEIDGGVKSLGILDKIGVWRRNRMTRRYPSDRQRQSERMLGDDWLISENQNVEAFLFR
jgi:hypothetical protein